MFLSWKCYYKIMLFFLFQDKTQKHLWDSKTNSYFHFFLDFKGLKKCYFFPLWQSLTKKVPDFTDKKMEPQKVKNCTFEDFWIFRRIGSYRNLQALYSTTLDFDDSHIYDPVHTSMGNATKLHVKIVNLYIKIHCII